MAPKVDANPLQPLLDALNSAEMAVEDAFDDTAEAIIDNINSLALPPALQAKVDAVCAWPCSTLQTQAASVHSAQLTRLVTVSQ